MADSGDKQGPAGLAAVASEGPAVRQAPAGKQVPVVARVDSGDKLADRAVRAAPAGELAELEDLAALEGAAKAEAAVEPVVEPVAAQGARAGAVDAEAARLA